MKTYLKYFLVVSIILLSNSFCKKTTEPAPVEPTPVVPTEKPIAVWQTRGDKSVLLSKIADLPYEEATGTVGIIQVNPGTVFQSIDGFGAALSGSSAYVFNKYLVASARSQLFTELFTKEGIGIDYIRVTMGASDFSLKNFSYNETPDDTLMLNFSIAEEMSDVIPMLKEIVAKNPSIKIMATPWSPPAWMKTNNSLIGGQLLPRYYHAYARYFVKYIEAMKAQGIVIDAVSVQNEPLHGTANYPCMYMFAREQREFIGDHLGPMFVANKISTRIIAYDHNWDKPLYADTVLQDAKAAQFIAGTAFHAYAGDVSAMSTLRSRHPSKNIYFTEISGGRWAPNFSDNLKWYLENIIIGTTRNWSKNALFWNLALDENDGPKNNGCTNCRGVVTVSSGGVITKNEEYYAIGHAGRFVQPGAKRCESSDISSQQIKNVAFINPDGGKVLVVVNLSSTSKKVGFGSESKSFAYTLDGNAVYTFTWK